MSTEYVGTIVGIEDLTVKTTTTALTTAGGAGPWPLPIEDMSGFPEGGGFALIGDLELAYTAAVDDPDGDYLTLSAALDADVPGGTDVLLSPLVQHRIAMVDIGDGEVYDCEVDGSNWSDARLQETATGGQSVLVEQLRNGIWRLIRPIGSPHEIHGGYVADATLPLSSTVDPEDAAGDQGGGAVLARLTNWLNVRLRNPIATSLDADGDGLTIGDPVGTLQFTAGGVVQTFLSAAYSRLAGHLSADSATFDGTTEHRGDVNIGEGATVNLLSDPKSPSAPGISVEWPSVVTDPPGSAAKAFAVAAGVGYYVRTLPKQKQGNANLEVRSFDPVTGGDSAQVWAASLSANTLIHGLVVGADWFTFVTTGFGAYAVQVRDTDGTLLNQWVPTTPAGGNSPCMGSDGTDLLLCWNSPSGYVIQHYSTAGVLGAVVTTSSHYGVPADILGGNFDFGSYRYIIREATGNQFDVYNAAGVEQTGEAWDSPVLISDPNSVGLAWDSVVGVFRELLFTGTSYTYSTAEKAQYLSPRTWWAFESWQDGTHETAYDAALPTSFVFPPRKTVRVSGAAIPSQATRGALYLAQSASLPARTSFHLQGTPVNGDRDWLVTNPGTGGAAPLATSTYPSGTAAAVKGVTTILDGTYSNAHTLPYRVDALEAGGGGGGGTGGIEIDCGTFGGAGADIDCGGFV